MEGRDCGESIPHHPSSCNPESSTASPAATLAELSADSPSRFPTHDPLSSEALENGSQLDFSSASSGAPSDGRFQDPSGVQDYGSLDLPSRDPSPISPKQQQQGALSLRERASMVQPLEESFSSLKSSQRFPSDQRLEADGISERPLREVQMEASLSEAPSEQLRQNPLSEATQLLSSDEGSQAKEPPSATQNSIADHPTTMSHEFSTQEDSPCNSVEQELPDDVKREMLTERCKGSAILTCKSEALEGLCYVYLIGTAHVSEESCREVRAAIALMKPEVVFVELCRKRSFILEKTHFSVPTVSDMLVSWKERRSNMLGILYSWFLAKVATKLDVLPGSEFRAAYEEAQVQGAKLCLGDRDIEVTLKRTWGKMSTWHKIKFIATLVLQAIFLPKADQLNELIEKLQDADMLTVAFEELGKTFPTVMETVIDERDMYMAAVLRKVAEDNASIVAVVGRGHVAGISKYWDQDINIHHLSEVPQKRSIWNATLKCYVLSATVAAVISVGALLYVRSGS